MGAQATQINDQRKGAYMRIWLSLGILMAITVGAYAGSADVPEIDAFSGLAAMGVIGSIAALVWAPQTQKITASRWRWSAAFSATDGADGADDHPHVHAAERRLS